MAFFSVIVPVYQAAPYLERCVNSVITQRFSDWELLLIDDGSTDGSAALCDAWAETDARVRAIHQPNGGAAAARNTGVSRAAGEYLLFLDSDDCWEGDTALEALADRLRQEGRDVCLYGCYDVAADSGRRVPSRGDYPEAVFAGGTKGDILCTLAERGQMPGACWILAVRRRLLAEGGIVFEAGNRAEDIDWLISVLLAAESLSCLNRRFYLYSKGRSDSVTGAAGFFSAQSVLRTVQRWSERLTRLPDDRVGSALYTYLIYCFFTTFVIYRRLPRQDRRALDGLYGRITLNPRRILRRSLRLAARMYSLVGPGITSMLLGMIGKGRTAA